MPLYRRPGSKHWWVRLSVAGRKARLSTYTSDRTQAEEFQERERERMWRQHKLGDKGAVRWQEVTARWLADSSRSRVRDREIVNDLAQYLDNESVSDIDPAALSELRSILLDSRKSKSTVDRYMRTIRSVLRFCRRLGVLDLVPSVPMFNIPAGEARWISKQQFGALLKQLPLHLKDPATFAVYTGLRKASMLSLTWDRIDLKNRRAWVPGSQMKARNTLGLPLNDQAMAVLRKLRRTAKGPYVFMYEGERLRNSNTAAFKKAVARAGLTPLRWHDLRHTFASWAVQNGVTLPELMALGAWKSYVSVLRYAHLSPDHLAQASAKIGAHRGTVRKRSSGTKSHE